jgi:hypothetical protein
LWRALCLRFVRTNDTALKLRKRYAVQIPLRRDARECVNVAGRTCELAETVAPADIVTLDRVINVYPDWKRLIRLSAARARHRYGLVVPRDTVPVRIVVAIMNFFVWRGPVRASVHPLEMIDKLLGEACLVRYYSRNKGPWRVAVYRRNDASTGCL